METTAQIENRAYAASVFGNCDDGSLHPDDATWELASIDIASIIPLMDGGVEGWRQWLTDEFENARMDGRISHWEAYLEVEDLKGHLDETADGPPVVSFSSDGKLAIWDGWHRLAACVVRGELRVDVIAGRRSEVVSQMGRSF